MTIVNATEPKADAVLREAEVEDIPDLVKLARAFYDEDGFATSDAMLRVNFEVLVVAENARVTLAFKNGVACGYALSTTVFTLESGLIAELQDLFVRPARRRQGLSSLLIADAVDWARRLSASSLELVVAPNGRDVSDLLRYYGARGFVNEGRLVLYRPL